MFSRGASSSSGSLIPSSGHVVFLSFRGMDTRFGFTYYLYKALDRENIKTFFDNRTLKRGENISAALVQAIELSKISLVICSENFGSSSWCLDELVKILECQDSKQQTVIPVFYKVDPSHVRCQTGSFGQAFAAHALKYKNQDKIPIWRAALQQVANLSGWTYVGGYESDFIDEIVKEIQECLNNQKKKEDVAGNNHQKKGGLLIKAVSFAPAIGLRFGKAWSWSFVDPKVRVSSVASGEGAVRFALSKKSTLVIHMGDITNWLVDGSTDAIVNSTNERMLGGGGADGAIHSAAGPDLLQACYGVPEARPGVRCPTGEARITPGFKLPASHVIHTVGPIYDLGNNPEIYLSSAYRSSLSIAKAHNIQYVAFPAISCGVYGYPYDEAADVALSTVQNFVNGIKEVHFVLFFEYIYNVWLDKANKLLKAI